MMNDAAALPDLQGYKGPTVAQFNPTETSGQQQALSAADRYSGQMAPAMNWANYALGPGQNPFNNPMLAGLLGYSNRATLDQLRYNVLPQIRTNAIQGNPYGSHSSEDVMNQQAMQQYLPRLQENYANQLTGLYESGQNRALQTANMMPTLAQQSLVPGQIYMDIGAQQRALEQQQLTENERLFQQNQMMPWQQLQFYNQLLGAPQGYDSTTKNTQSSGGLGSFLQGAAGLAMGLGGLGLTPFAASMAPNILGRLTGIGATSLGGYSPLQSSFGYFG
jgi:hypothetical protein